MIMEGLRGEDVYNDLKQDYLYSTLTLMELAEKYNTNKERVKRLTKDIRKEEGISKRPLKHLRSV